MHDCATANDLFLTISYILCQNFVIIHIHIIYNVLQNIFNYNIFVIVIVYGLLKYSFTQVLVCTPNGDGTSDQNKSPPCFSG